MPPLPRKEIRQRAHAFVKEWQGETREHAEAKPFWEAFFQIFGVTRRRIASFEEPVKKSGGGQGFVDLLWKGKLLIEHKSAGKDLDKAYTQALDYFPGLKEHELPRYVLVSDFACFSLHDLDNKTRHDFSLAELPDNIHLFDFIAGYEDLQPDHQDYALDFQAARILGALHDALKDSGYAGHELEVFLIRLLFCLFAEDTGIFARHQFVNYLLARTAEDGHDTVLHLGALFQVFDTPEDKRNKHLAEELAAFPYVNGHLFAERLDLPAFSGEMREQLLECAYFDWSAISPAIFGSLFQNVMGKSAERRALGAHYTSEKNILRLIKPLFLDDLWDEFNSLKLKKRNKQQELVRFQQKLSQLQFFDPACGCGNFLIVTYRELRLLELAVLRAQYGDKPDTHLALEIKPLIKIDNFHGIEIEEWPARIAEVAMWLTQHQMNREFARQFGREPDLLPLKTAAHIVNGNALKLDWREVVEIPSLEGMVSLYVLGNPPFRGSKFQTESQKAELAEIFGAIPNARQLDYVACWFYKAAQFIRETPVKAAFVSTNSITQGEQVAPLWKPLLEMGIRIHFAHRTFAWDSEAKGKAAVHVVIIGFSVGCAPQKDAAHTLHSEPCRLFDYPDIKGEPVEIAAENINPYLSDGPDVVLTSRNQPLCSVPPMWFGNMPLDGGHLLLSPEEKVELLTKEPQAEKWVRPLLGAEEFINGKERWCLWLVGIQPGELRGLPEVLKRVEQVKQFRLASKAESTRVHAERPTEFRDTRLPETYILVPSVSSERREYVPMGFFDSRTISTNLNLMIPDAGLYEFGVLESQMHMAWLRAVCGRLKSDFRYSAKLVYNNFPWPEPDKKQREEVEKQAQAVLDTRAAYVGNTLADLYDPLTMPADLRKAHQKLDAAVERCYRKEKFKDDAERLKFLFERYRELAEPGFLDSVVSAVTGFFSGKPAQEQDGEDESTP